MHDIKAITGKSSAYLADAAKRIADQNGRRIALRVRQLVEHEDAWRECCLNLNPAETLMSRGARALLNSDMATRLTEGVPGDKLYPHGKQNDSIDEIEATIIALARQQFGAKYVEWRPVSTTMANAAAFFATLKSGDVLLAQDEDGGGNYAYHSYGPAGLMKVQIETIPRLGRYFEVDLDALERLALRARPKLIALGGSNVLFPYPLREIRQIADMVGAKVLYDAAHLGLLISAGSFQRPLEEGAHIVTTSTAKSLGGPVGGLLFTNDKDLANQIIGLIFPGLLQTRDLNKLSALCLAMAENQTFGKARAAQSVANAKALAAALNTRGFRLLAGERGFTETHQIFLELGDAAKMFEMRCNAANILLTDCALSGDMALGRRSGSRLGTHEITRLGMEEGDMETVADLIARAFAGENPTTVCASVKQLLERFPTIAFSFDSGN